RTLTSLSYWKSAKLLTLPCKSPQLIKQGLCFLQILGIETLREPVIDRQEKSQSVSSPSLIVPERGEILCSSKFQGFDVLASRRVQCLFEQRLRVPLSIRCVADKQHPRLQPVQFGLEHPLAVPVDRC